MLHTQPFNAIFPLLVLLLANGPKRFQENPHGLLVVLSQARSISWRTIGEQVQHWMQMNTVLFERKLKINKLAPYGTDGRLFATDVCAQSRDTKTRPNIKNPAWSNLDIVL